MTPWITVVGLTDCGPSALTPKTLAHIETAEVLVGGERHLNLVNAAAAIQISWADGLSAAHDKIAEHHGKRVVILASGDPLHYGIGAQLVERFGSDAIHFIPAPGAFSLAAARMGWSLADVTCLTVHGRPLENVNLHLFPQARLLILSWDGQTPAALASLLTAKGFGDSRISVLEHMDGDNENRIDGLAKNWSVVETADLNTIAVECLAGSDAVFWPRVPGLPEAAYQHDGKITKREVRAATLAALAPLPGELLWDVGAGSGAVGIEWMRTHTSNKTVAFEKDASKHDVIKLNANNLGVPGLELIQGDVMASLPEIDATPDAIFVGGGVSSSDVLTLCWGRLKPGGRMIANGVTVEAHRNLMDFQSSHGGELVRISVARSGSVGQMTAMRPLMDVLQLKAHKK